MCKCMSTCVPFEKEDNDKIESGGDRVTMAGSQLTKTGSSSGTGRAILIDKHLMRQYDTAATSKVDSFRPVLAIPMSLAQLLQSGSGSQGRFSGEVTYCLATHSFLMVALLKLRQPLCMLVNCCNFSACVCARVCMCVCLYTLVPAGARVQPGISSAKGSF